MVQDAIRNQNEDDNPLEDQGRVITPDEPLLFELYHENSKQRAHDLAFAQRIYTINNSAVVHDVAANTFKNYPGAVISMLPHVHPTSGVEEAVAGRRSVRRFTGEAMKLEQLSRMLQFGHGLTGQLDGADEEPKQFIRAAPSGGALYPVEIYVIVHTVEGVTAGVHHYRVDNHSLELLRPGSWAALLGELTSDPSTFSGASVTFVLTAVFERSHFKYGQRAYRFALLEAGHVCQNLLLNATSIGLGSVPVGGFLDEGLHELLGLDGVDESALYLIPVGYSAPRPLQRSHRLRNQRDSSGIPNGELIERLLDSLSPPQS